ncbi:MAG TPA: hypothetical protein VLT79_12250 [Gemmatimonadales bacterium]|nr:hypothetical protein [Gemmatimonadales bacterium]
MIHTVTVALSPADIFARAKDFFGSRIPTSTAFPEKEGPTFLALRGQGGEELVISARLTSDDGGPVRSAVRGSTLFFDQALDRFFSTLPLESTVMVE